MDIWSTNIKTLPCTLHNDKMWRSFLHTGNALNNQSCDLLSVRIGHIRVIAVWIAKTIRRRIVKALTVDHATRWTLRTIWNVKKSSVRGCDNHVEVSWNVLQRKNIEHLLRSRSFYINNFLSVNLIVFRP